MAARETVSLKYRADIADLKRELAQIPGISAKQARQMAKELEVGLKKAERAAARAAAKSKRSFNDMARTAQSAGLAIAGAATAVVAFGQHLADLQNELSDASARTGIATDTLAGLRLAAEGSGLAFSSLEKGLDRLPKQMLDAANGVGTAKDAFARLGVDVTDAEGNLRDANDVFDETIAALGGIENDALKAASAAEIFGQKAGPGFIQSGAIDALDDYVSLSREFGLDTGPAAAKAAADFQRNVALLKDVGARQFQEIADALGGSGGIGTLLDLATGAMIVFGTVTTHVISEFSKRVGRLVDGPIRVMSMAMQGEFTEAARIFEETAGTTGQAWAELVVTPAMIVRDIAGGLGLATVELEKFYATQERIRKAQQEGRQIGGGGRDDTPGGDGGGGADTVGTAKEEVDERIKAFNRLRENQAAAAEARLSEVERVNLAFERQMETIFAASKARADADEVAAAADAAQIERILALDAIKDAAHKAEMARLKEQQEATIAASTEALDSLSGLAAQSAMMMAEASAEGTQRAAGVVFGVSKALALASIPLKVAEGIATAAALPPPADAIKAAAVIATGATQAAAIASAKPPTFDRGGIINSGTGDQVMASVLPGEAVLNRAATARLGTDGVNALNRGGSATGPIVVEMRYGHRVFDRFVQDNIAGPTPLGRALRGDRVTGRRR